VSAAPAGAAVTSGGDEAFLDMYQSVAFDNEVSQSANGNDFKTFSRTLAPPQTTGPAGRAKSTAKVNAKVVTPDSSFPFSQVLGTTSVTRLTNVAKKSTNADPYAPVAFSDGEYGMEFHVTSPTPFQLAAAAVAKNTDPDDCTRARVFLVGPVERTFDLEAGLDCTSVKRKSRNFVSYGKLTPGDYQIQFEGDTSISPDPPGDLYEAVASRDASLAFNPPDTKLTQSHISPAERSARFSFKAQGKAKGFQCALTRGKKKPRFRKCNSPKEYTGLRSGKYLFQVRVLGKVAPDATPAKKSFRIG
jgi:hypothetical protein